MNFPAMKKRLLPITLLVFFALFLKYKLLIRDLDSPYVCFATSENCGTSREGLYLDISSKETLNSKINSDPIVFLESTSRPVLTPRMVCTIESAAKSHKDRTIFVLMTSPVVRRTPILNAILQSYGNIKLVYFRPEELFQDSPLQILYQKKVWLSSSWPHILLSDISRWLFLWKFGGIYLDLDAVVVRSLNPLTNFSGLESEKMVGAGVFGFHPKHHPFLSQVLDQILDELNLTEWGAMAPKLLTRVLKYKCGLSPPSVETPQCPDIKIMGMKSFYPIPWQKWKQYFEENHTLTEELLGDTNTYVFHVWNALSHVEPLNLSQESPYAVAVRRFCPTVGDGVGPQM